MLLHVLLVILKVIGIILLAILCLILLIIGIVLLTPIRYEALGKGKRELSSLKGKVTVTYLLKLIQVDVIFSELVLKWRIRIAWKKLMGGRSYAKESNVTEPKTEESMDKIIVEEMKEEELDALLDAELAKQKECADIKENSGESTETPIPADNVQPDSDGEIYLGRTDVGDARQVDCVDGTEQFDFEKQSDSIERKDQKDYQGQKYETETVSKSEEKTKTDIKKSKKIKTSDKSIDVEERFEKGIQKIKCTGNKIYDKISKLHGEADDILDLATNEVHLKALLKVKKLVLKLIKRLLPKYIGGEGTIGFDNPATTGIVMAIYSMFYPFFDGKVELKPNFEQFMINGKLAVKGKLRLMSFFMLLLGIVVDFNCWKTFFHVKDYLKQREADEIAADEIDLTA